MEPILLQEAEVQTVGQCEQALYTAVTSKFDCTAILHGVNVTGWDSSSAKKSKVTPEERYCTTLPSGVKISVWKDDLTTHEVDAVVNAANEYLSHKGGLALALAQAGGPIIQQESDIITMQRGKVWTGEAVVTSAGKLPCKKLIHAVGPWVSPAATPSEIRDASKHLASAIDNILRITENENLQSVAIPAISSGLFNFPLDRCADIIVERLKKYSHYMTIREIRLVNNDEPSVSQMTRACKRVFGGSSKTYSGAVTASGQGSQISSVKLNRVTLHIITGHIEKQSTTAIVNTTSPGLDLSVGAISKAILKEAGQKLQSEVSSSRGAMKNSYGDVVRTKGCNLKAKLVYHVICAHKTPGSGASQMLSDIVSKCLVMAQTDSCASIAFPAIGSGELGFSKKEVAQIMTSTVEDFSSTHKGSSMDVYFVIYPSEDGTLQAFTQQHATLQRSHAHLSTSYTTPIESSASEKMTSLSVPYIELRAARCEVWFAARRWIHDILNIQRKASVLHTIRNDHIQHFGRVEHEELLSLQAKFDVGLEVFFTGDQAGINVKGSSSDVTAAVLEVEAMCCKVQEAYAQAEEATMLYSIVRWVCKDCPQLESPEISATLEKAYIEGKDVKTIDSETRFSFKNMEMQSKQGRYKMERICLFKDYRTVPGSSGKSYFERKLQEHSKESGKFKTAGLTVVCVERVENHALKLLFELNKKRITGSKTLYQRVPAQFCRFVSWVGFQREYSPPDVQALGQGIYFTASVKSAMSLWKGMEEEEYIYIIEAEVLTGKDTIGSRDLIVPPPKKDPLIRYDSVKGGTDTCVIFNGHQALPLYIYTLKKI